MFNVVIVLFTLVSPSRSGLARNGRPLLCVLRGIAPQPRLLPPSVLHEPLPASRDRQTPAAAWTEKSRRLHRQTPPLLLLAIARRLRAKESPAREFAPQLPAEKNGRAAPRSL